MSWPWMVSMVVLAFLIFMVIVLMYIRKAVKEEIEKTKLKLLIRVSMAMTEEMYNVDERSRGETVEKAMEIMQELINDWNVDVSYNPHKVKSRFRSLMG